MITEKKIRRITAFFLALLLVFHPSLVRMVGSEEGLVESGQEEIIGEETDSDNEVIAETSEEVNVTNENEAEVNNGLEVEANTGENTIAPEDSVAGEEQGDLDVEEGTSSAEVTPTPTPDEESEEDLSEEESEIDESEEEELDQFEGGGEELLVTAVNEQTPTGSESTASASSEETVEIVNENKAEVENDIETTAQTGENQTEGGCALATTGGATAQVDSANIVNTNLTGEDFWQAIINVFEDSSGDLDLSTVEGIENLDPQFISLLAQNLKTGDESTNLALVNFLSLLAIYNQNEALLTNNIDLLASSGQNQLIGDCGEIETGDAEAILNLFNMVNTNLIGSDWFFGVINLFGQFEGDIILPYELQFLSEESRSDLSTQAINSNSGEGSENQAIAEANFCLEVENSNQADLDNNVSVSANSGRNEIEGTGTIETGDADADLNLLNIVNTNIVGSRWLLLAINNFGEWAGELVGWWGDVFSFDGTTFAWISLPALGEGGTIQAGAINEETGEGSTNQALSLANSSTLIENQNQAEVENNINVTADSGNNLLEGKEGSIQTGNANASANIFNFINTNIVGNHWYFGIINIFDRFLGDIIFPRPNLSVIKAADREKVSPGEQMVFAISYQNNGQLWADGVVVVDTLPTGVDFISASGGGAYQNGQISWHLGRVEAGEGGVLEVMVQVKNDVVIGDKVVNNVQVTTSTDEPNQEDNQSAVGAAIIASSDSDGNGSSNGVGGTNDGSCHDQAPGGAPILLSAVPGENQVTLTWEKAPDPVSYYLIAYGESPGEYIYGNPNVGGVETTSYTVQNLSGGKAYYFVVRAGNGCAPGPFSNELAVIPFGATLEGRAAGFFPGVLGVQAAEGELSGALTNEGEIAGAQSKPICWGWLILPLIGASLLGAYYGLIGRGKRRFWWLMPLAVVGLVFLGDQYLAHRFFTPSQFCQWHWLGSLLSGIVPTAPYLYLIKK